MLICHGCKGNWIRLEGTLSLCAHGAQREVVYWWIPLPTSLRFPLYCDFEWMYPPAKDTGMCLLNLCDGWGLVLHSSAPPSESLFLTLSLWLFYHVLLSGTNKSQWFFISCCGDLRASVIFHQECVTHHYSVPPSHRFSHWHRGRSRWRYTINELFKWDAHLNARIMLFCGFLRSITWKGKAVFRSYMSCKIQSDLNWSLL